MRVVRLIVAMLTALFAVAAFAATDLTGTWRGRMDAGGEAVFHLKSSDQNIGGTMVADGKDYPITEGKLDGDSVSFTVASEWQGMAVKLIVTGKLAGDQMQLHIASDNGYWQTNVAVRWEAK